MLSARLEGLELSEFGISLSPLILRRSDETWADLLPGGYAVKRIPEGYGKYTLIGRSLLVVQCKLGPVFESTERERRGPRITALDLSSGTIGEWDPNWYFEMFFHTLSLAANTYVHRAFEWTDGGEIEWFFPNDSVVSIGPCREGALMDNSFGKPLELEDLRSAHLSYMHWCNIADHVESTKVQDRDLAREFDRVEFGLRAWRDAQRYNPWPAYKWVLLRAAYERLYSSKKGRRASLIANACAEELGGSPDVKNQTKAIVKEGYIVASGVSHNERTGPRRTPEDRKGLLTRYSELCREVISKRLETLSRSCLSG